MTEQQWTVVADKDRGDDPQWGMVEEGDRVTIGAPILDGMLIGTPVRIERLVPTTADPVRYNGHNGLAVFADASRRLSEDRTSAPQPPTREQVYHASAWAVRDAGGAATELQITEALDRLYGGDRMTVPTREQIAAEFVEKLRNTGGVPIDRIWARWRELFREYDDAVSALRQKGVER